MNISKDGKILCFSDDEILNDTNGEKKVFVTKRINGKESHVKATKTVGKHFKQKEEKNKKEETFNFNDEIVIGVNSKEEKKHKSSKKKKNKKKKAKKSKPISKILIAILTSIALIIIVVIFAFMAPIFNIESIEINGNEKIAKDTIISLSSLKKGENIFKFNNAICEKIKENAYIEETKISRKLPNTVIITIKERKIKYQINLINSYAYIDKNGYVLENSTVKEKVPVLVGLSVTEEEMLNKERLKSSDIEKLNKISKIMESSKTINIENMITEINMENEEDFVLYLQEKGKKIHIGDTSNLTNKMLYIQKILQGEEGKTGVAFVNGDIGSGFKPYFREE